MKVPMLSAAEWLAGPAGRRRFSLDTSVAERVDQIVDEVRRDGDAALRRLSLDLDGVVLDQLELSATDWDRGSSEATSDEVAALEAAADRIGRFHELQKPAPLRLGELELRPEALRRAGIYVPGGRARYPSTVLMNAIPARIAGVDEIVMCTPPSRDGSVAPAVLRAARIAGVDRIFRIGGAQAIAAMAFGTETVPAVDKVTGPGNAYVTLAKRALFGVIGIDGLAGPSEILVVADETADADQVVADLASQLEHDPQAWAVLMTTSSELAARVAERLGADELANRFAAETDHLNAAVVLLDAIDDAVEMVSAFAPEHLQLLVADPDALLPRVRGAGMIFAGHFSPVAMGDYVAGSNHTLPTGGAARYGSPLGVYDFYRWSSIVRLSPETAASVAPVGIELAKTEGLVAHQRSLEVLLARLSANAPHPTSPRESPRESGFAGTPTRGEENVAL